MKVIRSKCFYYKKKDKDKDKESDKVKHSAICSRVDTYNVRYKCFRSSSVNVFICLSI